MKLLSAGKYWANYRIVYLDIDAHVAPLLLLLFRPSSIQSDRVSCL